MLAGRQPPTAIIASNDQMALAVLDVARARGVPVPEELSIISFDNTPIVRVTQPPLTALDQPIAQIAARAVDLILASLRGERAPGEITVVPATLVERGSVAKPPTATGR